LGILAVKILVVCGMESEANLIGQRPGLITVVGAGDAVALAAKIEAAIAAGGIDRIISAGVVGALNPLLRPGDLVLGVAVCRGGNVIQTDAEWTHRLWGALNGLDAPSFSVSHERFAWSAVSVNTIAAKAALRIATSADVVDMESWPAASLARAHDLPFAVLRVVLDPASFGLPAAAQAHLTASGGVDLAAVLDSLAAAPGQIGALAELQGYQDVALANLGEALALVGDRFSAYPMT
jgi:nucleoside phosphorylase